MGAPVPGKHAAFSWCIPCRQGYSPGGVSPLPWELLAFPGSSLWLSARGAQCQVRASPPGSSLGKLAISARVLLSNSGQLAVKEQAVN